MIRYTLAIALVAALGAAVPAVSTSTAMAQTVSADGVRDVAGTRWTGPALWAGGERKIWTLTFRRDGVLVYSYDGNTYDNGRWLQRDRLVIFHTNDYFAVYAGVLDARGRTFTGDMHNVRGDNGVFEFQLAQ